MDSEDLKTAIRHSTRMALWETAVEDIIHGVPSVEPSMMKSTALALATSITTTPNADATVKHAIEMAIETFASGISLARAIPGFRRAVLN